MSTSATTQPQYSGAVITLAHAIRVAEGSNPAWNNPGDLTYAFGYPTNGTVNSEGVLRFCSADDGLNALYHECGLMLAGRSHVYRLTDTIADVGVKYAGTAGASDWSRNVAAFLGVSETTTLAELAA